MIHFGWAIAALFIGGTLGFFISGLCFAAAENERQRIEDERRMEE